MKPSLTIIILSFNTKDLTIRAVKSCLTGKFQDLKVVVVDNHSHDGTVQALRKAFGSDAQFELIARDVNDGFAAGNNIALAKVNSPYCMLLNSDAFLDQETDLQMALEYLEANPHVGVLTPHVTLGNGKLDPASHRGFPTPWNAFTYFSGLESIFGGRIFGGYHQVWKNLKQIHEIDACSGAAMMVRTEAMKKIGLLDEQFFMYGEDLDWCYRFKDKGWQVVFLPSVLVHHDKHTSGVKKTHVAGLSAATHEIQTKSRGAFYEAMRLFYNKHYANVYPAWVRQVMFAGIEVVRKIKKH